MALFAAYADVKDDNDKAEESSSTWLTNSSFKIDVTPFQQSEIKLLHPKHLDSTLISSSSSEENANTPIELEQDRKRKKSKKKSKKHKHKKDKQETEGEAKDYAIDKSRATELKYANTIARPSAPKYHVYKYIAIKKEKKAKKFKRYYQVRIDKNVNKTDDCDKSKIHCASMDLNNDLTILEEQEMSRQTADYNRELQQDPYNITKWIGYVNFQDTIFNFEKSFRKGSIAKGQRVTAERKLAILDKALQHNPDCETLLRMRLDIAVSVFPADELQTQLKKLVERDSGNIILWQGYIEATQCSMSHCTTPTVINLYIKCLHTLHTIRRTAKLKRALLEESILRMLYQCGLFLKQAGLFEQLWTLLRMYLELNLNNECADFHQNSLDTNTNESQLVDLEDTVLKSQLPIHELWLRIEKLREHSHWLPVASAQSDSSIDPQRLVFSEDVSELIHPITMPGNTFRLTVTILTLLKVPLLPSRHVTMKEFGVDYVPWALDAIETLLPVFYPLYPFDINNTNFLLNAQKLAVGPQYLKTLPGQEEYLQFILEVMTNCAKCLEGNEKTALIVWWFRFLRLLTVLEKRNMFKITSSLKKKLKSEMKNVLRDNSTNLVLFKEYALVQAENNHETGLNVLETALITNCGNIGYVFNASDEQRVGVVSTLRTLVELHLFHDKQLDVTTKKQMLLKLICSIITGKFTLEEAPRFINQVIIDETKQKFCEINEVLLQNHKSDNLSSVDHFLPDYTTDCFILNAYFLLLQNFNEARIFIENLLLELRKNQEEISVEVGDTTSDNKTTINTKELLRTEVLQEFLVAVVFKKCLETPGAGLYPTLDKHLQLGIEQFPNNLFLLGTLARVQSFHSNYGQPWWKIQSFLLKSGHALATMFSVLIANQRINDIESKWVDTVTGKVIETDNTFKNRMLNLFKRITRSDMCTRRCGLVWRLYLQFLHAYFEPKACRDAYYLAVEECPWLKALYIDAAIYIPEDLAQIQDLIIEKQLRIHVTPEELDVLRN